MRGTNGDYPPARIPEQLVEEGAQVVIDLFEARDSVVSIRLGFDSSAGALQARADLGFEGGATGERSQPGLQLH
jgi:hypothetical protein